MKYQIVVLAILLNLALAHMCLYAPAMRADADGVLTQSEYTSTTSPLPKCKRNVNVGWYGNRNSSQFGSVCGGSSTHPGQSPVNSWNAAVTPSAGNTYTAGTDATIQILLNAAHVSLDNNRFGFIIIDYSSSPSPTSNSDFSPIAIVASGSTSNAQIEHTWSIPSTVSFDHGTLRAIYVTSLADTAPDPSSSGVSNTYTSCADIRINSASPAAVGPAMALAALFF